MPERQRKLPELDGMNALSCLCVVTVHVLSATVTSVDLKTTLGALVYFVWYIASFAVPVFIFTSAYKMSRSFRDRAVSPQDYGHYLWGRVKKIYLPYLLWSTVYYLFFVAIGWETLSLGGYGKHLLTGDISAQFYFVIVIMQFYLLMPLWMALVKRVPRYLALGISLLLFFAALNLDGILANWSLSFPYADRIFIRFLPYWVLGLYEGKDDLTVREPKLTTPVLLLGGGLVLSCTLLMYLQQVYQIYLLPIGYVEAVAMTVWIYLLLALCRKALRFPRLTTLWSQIHEASYSVFLSHCLVVTAVNLLLSRLGWRELAALPVRAVICFTVPFLLYRIQCRLLRRNQSCRI